MAALLFWPGKIELATPALILPLFIFIPVSFVMGIITAGSEISILVRFFRIIITPYAGLLSCIGGLLSIVQFSTAIQ